MATAAPNSYLKNAVLTASPEQLQLMLYDGAIRFANQGKEALIARDFEQSFEKLSRAQAILTEMESGLRFEVNPELCERMAAIYNFIYRRLVEANVHQDPGAIEDAVKILRLERETWVLLMDKVTAIRAEHAPVPIRTDIELKPQPGSLCIEG
jgi:flagellar protein FliS